jgi:prephenate dehydratase
MCKDMGHKPSQVIDAVLFFIGIEGCMNLNRMKKALGELDREMEMVE